jgi:hypothetical protein
MQAIETRYNGHRFRSRTEARWAVLLDHLGVKYEYEPEGYELGDGVRYLPDFYLPAEDCYIEIKGDPESVDWDKIGAFASRIRKTVIVAMGQPGYHEITASIPREFPAPEARKKDIEAWLEKAPSNWVRKAAEYALVAEDLYGFTSYYGLPWHVWGLRLSRSFCDLDYSTALHRLALITVDVRTERHTRWAHEPTGAWAPNYVKSTYAMWRPLNATEEELERADEDVDPQERADTGRRSREFENAVMAARSARFEFGESGAG